MTVVGLTSRSTVQCHAFRYYQFTETDPILGHSASGAGPDAASVFASDAASAAGPVLVSAAASVAAFDAASGAVSDAASVPASDAASVAAPDAASVSASEAASVAVSVQVEKRYVYYVGGFWVWQEPPLVVQMTRTQNPPTLI